MIDRIIEFSARHKFLVLILALVAVAGAVYTMQEMPLDAIPDLSDTQVIIYSRWDRSPDIVEDLVTYPIVTAMLGVFWLSYLGWIDPRAISMPETYLRPQIAGGLVFGAGFALAGLCPGTSCVAAASGRGDRLNGLCILPTP